MASVKVELANRPKGAKFSVPGLGTFENGSTTEVDERRWERFKRRSGFTGDSLEFSSESFTEATESQAKLTEAVQQDSLDSLKKDELVELAEPRGIEVEGKTKDDLISDLNPNPEV